MIQPQYATVADIIGQTPLVCLNRMASHTTSTVLIKLEGNNPAGSVKDRPAYHMILAAQNRGDIKPGQTLIEPTSGNTGIALAMAAAVMGYKMVIVMPEDASAERLQIMKAYGAQVILTPKEESMPGAINQANKLIEAGEGVMLNQFANSDNPLAHVVSTGPEIWEQTAGNITHFVSSMGTTGTIMGVSEYLKQKNPNIQIIGVQPQTGSQIPGIRKWEEEYLPKICDFSRIDEIRYVSGQQAEETTRKLAKDEGLLLGPSSGGALTIALEIAQENQNATIVSIGCDRGDRYLSTGLFK
ncbi:cysteine synthase CysM [Neisseria sp. Ec49-e6-T10]|uniref:cysteine synthase CysM n=1 Tax=Neisseria sp. Ec49-e6-T10 TaxID=3140744 RepID=UPI003EB70473